MKELKTYETGRMPVVQYDLNYIQTAPREVLLSLINELGLGTTNFIIAGCRLTYVNGVASMTAGWAYYNGEILRVEAPSSIETPVTPVASLVKVAYCSGQKAFEFNNDTDMRDAYQDDFLRATLLPCTTLQNIGFGLQPGAWTLAERLRHNVLPEETDWQNAGGTYGDSIFYKKWGKMVQLKGMAFNDAGVFDNATVATGLPVPAAGMSLFPVSEPPNTMLKIDASGNLIVTGGNRVRFNHVAYLCNTAATGNDGHISALNPVTPGGNDAAN